MEALSPIEKRVLLALGAIGEKATPEEIQEQGGFRQLVEVMNGSSWLQSKGLVRHEETLRVHYALGKEGTQALERDLPERRALEAIHDAGGTLPLPDLQARADFEKGEIGIATGWLKRKDLAELTKDPSGTTTLTLTDKGRRIASGEEAMPDEEVLKALADGEKPEGGVDATGLQILSGRQNMVKKREDITRIIHLTTKGKRVLEQGIEVKEEVSQVTPELIQTGKWKEADIRPYDVQAFAPVATGGKRHPLRQIIDKVRRIMLEMGFTEIEGPYYNSAFWDLDALYVPQEHPAREMQDTFYLSRPAVAKLDDEFVETVKAVHEHGGDTGSTGWRYRWSADIARQMLLRTHTTVDTVAYLKKNPEPPVRVFSVDRVFRNEAIDATHLPEFHQVEGIVLEEGANLRMLIGTLKAIYKKMGFEDLRVRPAYFPYTEPSLEIEVFYNGRWMEMGGAGIFRPEVTEPLGVKHPVLAWGLGLERLAMVTLGLTDIRDLYVSDVEWLRNAPLVR